MNEHLESFKLCYPNIDECSIQTFTDVKWQVKPKERDPLAKIFGMNDIESIYPLVEKWAWVFFSVNSMVKGKRDQRSVTKVNARICEVDDMSKEAQMKLIDVAPIKPSLIIESKNSYHMYRFSKDWTKERWNDVCNGLKNFFHWDPDVVDIARVLRVPWFYHQKQLDDRYLITIKEFNWKYFTEEEMLRKYKDHRSDSDRKQEQKRKETLAKKNFEDDDLWTRVNSMDSKKVLEMLSWTSAVNWEVFDFRRNNNWTEQIYVNWMSTWKWIDTNWSIWWVWSWVWWVLWYGVMDSPQIYQWVKEKFPEMIKKTKVKEESKSASKDEHKHKEKFFSFWLSTIDKKFGMPQVWDLMMIAWYPSSWKTEFSYFMARKTSLTDKVLYFSLEFSENAMKKRLARKVAWISKYEYQKKLYTESQKYIMDETYKKLDSYKDIEFINYEWTPTVEDIIEDIKKRPQYEIIYIDAMWNMWWDINENIRYANITKLLRLYVRNHDVCIMLVHHMNKPSASEAFRPWWIAKLRWTQKIVDDCTLIFEVFRDQDPTLENWKEKSTVSVLQYKDTQDWATWVQDIYFSRWEYTEEYNNF